jgi:hypothetical protein
MNEVIPTDMSDYSEKVDEARQKQTDMKLRRLCFPATIAQYLSQQSIKRTGIEKYSVRALPMKVIGILSVYGLMTPRLVSHLKRWL